MFLVIQLTRIEVGFGMGQFIHRNMKKSVGKMCFREAECVLKSTCLGSDFSKS